MFRLPKAGNGPEECEDSSWPKTDQEFEGDVWRLAIADGATDAMLSGEWASGLVESFCTIDTPVEAVEPLLHQAYTVWDAWKARYLKDREEQNRPLRWYEEPGLQAGAFATLLGLRLEGDNSGAWQAIAVGDSCLFQVRRESLVTSFPLTHSMEFGSNPQLISSIPSRNTSIQNAVKHVAGEWQLDDRFYLATDALAHWLLSVSEIGQPPWSILRDLNTYDQYFSFEGLINELRNQHLIKNDDVTLVRIDMA